MDLDRSSRGTKNRVLLTSFITYKIYALNSSSELEDEDNDKKSDEVFCSKCCQVLINNGASR